jgi:CRP-like cAMP-binding protein
MPTLQLYDHLLKFPLFQGMSRDNLARVAGHTKFGFLKLGSNQIVAEEDQKCSSLYFMLSGTLKVSTASDDHAYKVVEQLSAPYLLQPEALFGINQRFTHTFETLSECSFIILDKPEVMRLTEEFMVFRLNILNLMAAQTQKLLHQPWQRYPTTLGERIVRFMHQHCIYPAGPKTFYILMTRLADEVGDSRLDVSRALNQMQRDGLLQLHRGRIEIPQMERLLM